MSEPQLPEAIGKLYRQRWRIWIIACLAHSIGLFHRASMAPLADRLMADFSISATVFGSLGAVYFYVYSAMQVPAGTLADTLGPRKTITLGLITSATGALIMSQAPTFTAVYTGRLLISFGVSVVWINAVKLISEWFRHREQATITGISISVINLGQVAAATPLAFFIGLVGWRVSILTISLITYGLAAAAWLIIRNSPVQVGLPPVWKLNGRDHAPDGIKAEASISLGQRLKLVFGNKRLIPLFLGHLGVVGAYSTFFNNWAVIYIMQTYGTARDAAANFVLTAAVGLIAGSTIAGLFSDRIFRSKRQPAVVFIGIFLTFFLVLTFGNGGQPPLNTLYPICFFIGLGIGVSPIIFAAVSDVAPPSLRGTATGLVNSGGFISAAVAQPLFGYLIDRGWQGEMVDGVRFYPQAAFHQGLIVCCILAAIGFVGILFYHDKHGQKKSPESLSPR